MIAVSSDYDCSSLHLGDKEFAKLTKEGRVDLLSLTGSKTDNLNGSLVDKTQFLISKDETEGYLNQNEESSSKES